MASESVHCKHSYHRKGEMVKKITLPLPSDLEMFSEFLKSELNHLNFQEADPIVFIRAVQLVQSRLVVYNKRRPGEIEDMR